MISPCAANDHESAFNDELSRASRHNQALVATGSGRSRSSVQAASYEFSELRVQSPFNTSNACRRTRVTVPSVLSPPREVSAQYTCLRDTCPSSDPADGHRIQRASGPDQVQRSGQSKGFHVLLKRDTVLLAATCPRSDKAALTMAMASEKADLHGSHHPADRHLRNPRHPV